MHVNREVSTYCFQLCPCCGGHWWQCCGCSVPISAAVSSSATSSSFAERVWLPTSPPVQQISAADVAVRIAWNCGSSARSAGNLCAAFAALLEHFSPAEAPSEVRVRRSLAAAGVEQRAACGEKMLLVQHVASQPYVPALCDVLALSKPCGWWSTSQVQHSELHGLK